jgi:multidrug efflux pump subunit AcrA (membrane-fusion protein)
MARARGIRRYRGWIALGALVAVGAVAYLLLRDGSNETGTVTYQTEAATLGTISVTVSGTGNVEVDGTTEVWSPVAGTVESVNVTEGSLVSTGTVLFTLDGASAETSVARALASVRQSEQSVAQAQLQITKTQSALAALKTRSTEPSSTVAAADITASEADVKVATAQLASAQAQRTTAQLDYSAAVDARDDLVVTAPCSGRVYDLAIAAGDSVSATGGSTTSSSGTGAATAGTTTATSSGAPVTLAPNQPLAVHLTINEVDLPGLEVGQRADLEFDAFPDFTATGKVYDIADSGSNSSGVVTFDVWVSIDVADPALRAGMSAAATIVTDIARDALLVSNSAVKTDSAGGYYVLVLADGAGEPRQVTVETGLASDTQTQVTAGLSEGDLVVTQTIDPSDTDTQTGSGGGSIMVPGMGGGGGFRE